MLESALVISSVLFAVLLTTLFVGGPVGVITWFKIRDGS
jgi:hypothetical protein